MLPWEQLDSAIIPGQGGTLHLYRRGQEYSIRLDNYELMNSRQHGSEDTLAELTCKKMSSKPRPRILIGGLGMGYTLAAALKYLGEKKATIVVAELVEAVVHWNHGPLAHLAHTPLADSRVSVSIEDVGAIIRNETNGFDAIILDVDNGPEGLTRPENDQLYGLTGLKETRQALSKGGIMAIWSAGPDTKFSQRLTRAGFTFEEVHVKSRKGNKGNRHVIWLAKK